MDYFESSEPGSSFLEVIVGLAMCVVLIGLFLTSFGSHANDFSEP